MTQISRRRFIAITAACVALPAGAAPLHHWRGTALGAAASIRLAHPDAPAIVARARAEISRLEDIFSLYRPASALVQLNAEARLDAPPFELLSCLALAGRVHQATGGLFDPSVQPLWAAYAQAHAAGGAPDEARIAAALDRTGWARVRFDSASVRLDPGMALTLNGIAQGFVADRVADLLRAEGLTNILIDTGELRALGTQPGGEPWPVSIDQGGALTLQDRALATSSPLGTVFDAGGRVGHILHPQTGRPAAPVWRGVSVTAPSAALADALSTAACLMPQRADIDRALAAFRDTRLEAALAA
jgi:thiamine biosynthesis lipoprotein